MPADSVQPDSNLDASAAAGQDYVSGGAAHASSNEAKVDTPQAREASTSPSAGPGPASRLRTRPHTGVRSAQLKVPVFVAFVIFMGASATLLGLSKGLERQASELSTLGTVPSLAPFSQVLMAIGLLIALAVLAELLQLTLYGPDTVSVSVAIGFAAALLTGIPGVACVSAAIALVHYFKRRPALYKTAFNWATHIMAGVVPALALDTLGLRLHPDDLLVLLVPMSLAAVGYYLIDTGLVAMAIALSSGPHAPLYPVVVWRERFQWLAGHYLVLCVLGLFLSTAYLAQGPMGMVVFTVPVLMMRYSQQQYIERTEDSVRELRRMNEELSLANDEVVVANGAIKQLNNELFLTLAKMIDARDPYVGEHAAKVADYAVAIGVEIDIAHERIEPLRQAGFLHDIGKIAISEAVLHKPTRLTPDEYEYVKTHAAIGGEFLELSRGLRHLAPFVRHHHERWDGFGYPDNLKGEDIPLEARILAICDAAEAMASDRPYRKGMSLDEMIAEVKRCAGSQFDPVVAKAFVRVVERERDHLVVNSAHEVALRKGKQPDIPELSLREPVPVSK